MSAPIDTATQVTMTYADALRAALRLELERNPELLVIGEDIGRAGGMFTVTRRLDEMFGDRLVDMPISEAGFAGMAIGAAMGGTPVVVELQVVDFALLAVDQITNAGNLHFVSGGQVDVPVVFRGPCGFSTGFGVTHSQHLEGIFAGRPGVKVVMPSGAADAGGLLLSAIRDPNPVVLLEHVALYFRREAAPAIPLPIPLGSARVVEEGTGCTLVTAGRGVIVARQARAELPDDLAAQVEVIDLRSLSPVDWDTLGASIARTGRLVVAFDGPATGSYAMALTGELARRHFDDLRTAPVAVTGADVPAAVDAGAEAVAGITPERVAAALRRILSDGGRRR